MSKRRVQSAHNWLMQPCEALTESILMSVRVVQNISMIQNVKHWTLYVCARRTELIILIHGIAVRQNVLQDKLLWGHTKPGFENISW